MKKQIGDRILDAIERKNLTQRKAAELLNISPAALNNYITNKRKPDIDMLILISKALDTNPNQLLDYPAESKDLNKEKLLKIWNTMNNDEKDALLKVLSISQK